MKTYPRGFIFDLDGTLIDSYKPITESLNFVLENVGFSRLPIERARRLVGRGLEELIRDTAGEENIEKGVKLFRERYREIFLANTRLLPGVRKTLKRLHERGNSMAVATNKPSFFSEKILVHKKIMKYFRVVLGPDSVAHPKPHPCMMREVLRRLGLEKDEVIYVGDMVIDVETARRAGVTVCVVPGGSSTREDLLAAKPDYFARSFSEIGELFSGFRRYD